MPNPFFNKAQGRLRAFWRLAIFFAAYAAAFAASLVIPGVRESELSMRGVFTLLALAALSFSGKAIDRRPFASYGFGMDRRWFSDLAFGIGLGAALMAAVFVSESALGFARSAAFSAGGRIAAAASGLGKSFLLCAAISIQEELLARAYVMRNLAEGFNSRAIGPKAALWAAYLASSSFFGALHAWNPHASLSSVLLLCLAGLLLGLPYFLSGELALSLGLHFSWNFFQGPVFGFRVSGTDLGYSLISFDQAGPTWLTGGAFGPEGGLAGILAIAVGALSISLWMKRTRPPLSPCRKLAEYSPLPSRSPGGTETAGRS